MDENKEQQTNEVSEPTVELNETAETKETSNVQASFEPAPSSNATNNVAQNFEPLGSNGGKKKKKGKFGLFLVIVLLLAAVAAGVYYFLFAKEKDPQKVFQSEIDKAFTTAEKKTEDFSKIKINGEVSVNLDLEDDFIEDVFGDEDLGNEIIKVINKSKVSGDIQADYEKLKEYVALKWNYDGDNLIDAKIFADMEEGNIYASIPDFFSKTIKIPFEDADMEEIKELFNSISENSKERADDAEKAIEAVQKELKKAVKEKYCSTEKEKISINGKDVNTDVYVIEMTMEEAAKELKSVIENLSENKDFMNLFGDEKDNVKESFEELVEELNDLDSDVFNEEDKFAIKIYKTTLKQETVKCELIAKVEGQEYSIDIEKDNDNYTIKVKSGDSTLAQVNVESDKKNRTVKAELKVTGQKVATVTLKSEKTKKDEFDGSVEVEVIKMGKITVNAKGKVVYGEDIDTLNTSKAVSIDDLTEKDAQELEDNFMKSKLYKFIEEFAGEDAVDSLFGKSGIEEVEDKDITEGKESSSLKENQVKTYSKETLIEFKVPSGYEFTNISDNFRAFDKNDIAVNVKSDYSNEDEYYEEIKKTANYLVKSYEERGEKIEYNVGELQNTTVNGTEFKYVLSTRQTEDYKDYNMYVWTKANDTEIYLVEIRSDKEVDIKDFEDFLTIEIQK